MLSEWMSGLRLRRARCTSTVDLLICDKRNEELIMKNEADKSQLAIADCFGSFQKFRDSSDLIHRV